jgi:hypothetical protein
MFAAKAWAVIRGFEGERRPIEFCCGTALKLGGTIRVPAAPARNTSGAAASAARVLGKSDGNDPASMDESHFRASEGALPISKTVWMNRYFVPRRNLVFHFL